MTQSNSTSSVVPYKGYEILIDSDGRKTTSCKVRLATVGVSRELGSITAAKEWVTARDAQPMERREPFETLTSTEPTDNRDPFELKAVIIDFWEDSDREEDEIRVEHPLGSCSFPYKRSSERSGQASNARAYAKRLVDEGKCAGIDDRIEPSDIRDPAKLKAVIIDIWADNDRKEDEIRVDHPLGSCGFPYEDSSDRWDQVRNARAHAKRLVEEGKCAGIDDRIDMSVPFTAQRDIERPRT